MCMCICAYINTHTHAHIHTHKGILGQLHPNIWSLEKVLLTENVHMHVTRYVSTNQSEVKLFGGGNYQQSSIIQTHKAII